jgi:hypothetical protein
VCLKVESDALKLEKLKLHAKVEYVDLLKKQLNSAKLLFDNITRDRDYFKLKSRCAQGNIKAMSEEIDTIKRETETLRPLCKHRSVLEKLLHTVREQCACVKKEKNAFILRSRRIAADREAVRN